MNRHPFRPATRLLLLALPALVVCVAAAPGVAQTAEEATPMPEGSGATGEPVPAEEGAEAPAEGAASTEQAEEAAETPEEDLAADFYLSRCAGCHTIGEGELSGPDLAPATGWPAPDLTKAVERMEKNVGSMTDEQVAGLVELLKSEDVKQRLSAARERQMMEMAATLEPASPEIGEELFHGGRSFGAGGVSCSACHRAPKGGQARGGTLAADLTKAYSRLGEQAVIAAAETPGFPLMRAAYADHPVTRQEAVHLAAYLEEVDEAAGDERAAAGAAGVPIGWWGAAAAALFLGAMVLLYRGRNRGVRARLVQRAHQR